MAGATDPPDTPPWRTYARAIRSHPFLVALAVLLALAGSIAALALRTPEYEASARLLIHPVSQDDVALLGLPLLRDAGDPTRTVETAAALMRSPVNASATARRLGSGWSSEEVLDAVGVEPAGVSNILVLTATADTPARAAALANAFATAGLEARNVQLWAALDKEIARLREVLGSGAAPAPTETSARLARLEQLRGSPDPTVSLAERATRPGAASGPSPALVVALALIAGAVLGAVLAFVAELRSPRPVADEDELLSIVPAPVLARLPHAWHRFSGEPGSRSGTPSEIAFRSLHVQLGLLGGQRRTVMVSSPGGGDGKTNFVASLALRLAAEGQDVIIMDLNLLAPRAADLLGVNSEPGLAATLEPGGSLSSALLPVDGIPGLRIVPGVHDARLSALDALQLRLPQLLGEAHSMGSHVLLDAPPLGTLIDAALLLEGIDDLVIVVRFGHTKMADVEAMRDVLWRTGRRPSGFVLIGAGPRSGHPSAAPPAPPPRLPAEPVALEALRLPAGSFPGLNDGEPSNHEFEPGERVAWTRGSMHGVGEVVRRLTTPTRANSWEGAAPEAEPRYLIKTDRAGERLACRASALARVSNGE